MWWSHFVIFEIFLVLVPRGYYHILVKQMAAEQCDNDTSNLLVILCSKLYTSITLNLNKCTHILYVLYVHLPVQSLQHNNTRRPFFLGLNKSTFETRKNVFYFTSKGLFVLEKIKF